MCALCRDGIALSFCWFPLCHQASVLSADLRLSLLPSSHRITLRACGQEVPSFVQSAAKH